MLSLALALVLALADPAVALPSVLVMDLETLGVDATRTKVLNGKLAQSAGDVAGIDVIAADELKRMTELESAKQAMACDAESCMGELANALGARYVLFGRVADVDGVLLVQLNLFDSQLAKTIARREVRGAQALELADKVALAVHEILAPLSVSPSSAVDAASLREVSGAAAPLPLLGIAGGAVAVVGLVAATALGAWAFAIEDDLGKPGREVSSETKAELLQTGPLVVGAAVGGGVVAALGVGLLVFAAVE